MRNIFGGDPHFNNLGVHLPLLKDIKDVSKNNVSVTLNGTAIFRETLFIDNITNGAGSGYLSNIPIVAGSDEDFTLEMYVNMATTSANYYELIIGTVSGYPFGIRFGNGGFGNKLQWGTNLANLSYIYSCDVTVTNCYNTWTHIALVRYKNYITLYVNGIPKMVNTGANPSTYPYYNVYFNTSINTNFNIGTNYFTGHIKYFRYTKGIARYTNRFFIENSLPLHGISRVSHLTPLPVSEIKMPPMVASNNQVCGDIHFNNVVLQVPLRGGSARDTSKYTVTTTVSGDVILNNEYASFSGTADMVKIAGTAHSPQGTEDWTIECWVYTGFSSQDREVYSQRYDSGDIQNAYFLRRTTANVARFFWKSSNVTIIDVLTSNTIPQNVWTHIAIVRKNQSVNIYFNGVKQDISGTNSSGSLTANAAGLSIGASDWGETGDYGWIGNIRDFRITRGIARYTLSFTPPKLLLSHGVALNNTKYIPTYYKGISARPIIIRKNTENSIEYNYNNLDLNIPFTKDIKDYSKISHSLSVYGNTTILDNSVYFDGSGDYISIPDSSHFDVLGDKTIELMFKPQSPANTGYTLGIFGTGDPSTSGGWLIGFYDGKVSIRNNGDFFSGIGTVTVGNWYHIALVWYKTKFLCFLDGKVIYTSDSNIPIVTSTNLIIGNVSPINSNRYFNGYVKNIKIYNNLAKYTSNFDIGYARETAPIITNTVVAPQKTILYIPKLYNYINYNNKLHLNIFNSSYIDNSIYKRSLTSTNTVIAEGGIKFNGLNSYITIPDSDDFYLGSNDFTIICSIKPYSYDGCIFEKAGGNMIDYGNILMLITSGGILRFTLNPQSSSETNKLVMESVSTVKLNEWNDIVIVRRLNTFYMFINNKLDKVVSHTYGSWNDPYSMLFGAAKVSGTPASAWFNGIIKNFKLINGFAVAPNVKLWTQ